ncbi:hypothetical protein HMPREF0868_1271 [Mageeibacillus indolicus UPII9-5]|uniref:Uncharacterized protein n=1 Tax=Mageeibacillus indolicus (strain UPII9-5) TaxID=699246 RepID=D3R2Y6_MAGIU|nr:hypothetical protein HMPREF0868_1271 [Mageeibacillus indolicus UPII9-5]
MLKVVLIIEKSPIMLDISGSFVAFCRFFDLFLYCFVA